MVLLHFLRWLRSTREVTFTVMLGDAGPLSAEFAALAPVQFFDSPVMPGRGIIRRALRRLLARKRIWLKLITRQLARHPPALIYSNTAINGPVLDALAPLGCPVISHVHELEFNLQRRGPQNLDSVKRHTTLFVAASEAVARNLCDCHGIPPEKIVVVHEFIPAHLPAGIQDCGLRIRAELGIPPDAFVVAGRGVEMWRKGKDLFVQLAAKTVRSSPGREFFFLWVGPVPDTEDFHWLCHDAKQAGINDRIRWVGEVANPLDYFSASDVFAMVSREDPFPLVCLEAALLQKPAVCFAGAGGAPELVGSDAGFVVPYLDLQAMAQKLLELSRDDALRTCLGARAGSKVREHFSVGVAGPRLLAIINQLIDADQHS
jgi:glycosyltransferase involved in cell wall biosynthesis